MNSHLNTDVNNYVDTLEKKNSINVSHQLSDLVGDSNNNNDNLESLKYIHNSLMQAYQEGTLSESFNDVCDIHYVIDSDKRYLAVQLLLACGGPNIWLDSSTGLLRLYWWTEYAELRVDKELLDAIDEIFKERYECL